MCRGYPAVQVMADQSRAPHPAPDRYRVSRAQNATSTPVPQHSCGPHRRFTRQLREAALRATHDELTDLERLETLVRLGAITVFEASQNLRALLRQQHQREQQAKAA